MGPHKEPLERAVKDVRDALAGTDVARIESALKTLTDANHKVSEALYSAASGGGADAGGAGQGSANAKGGDDVIDAEFEETR
jgi:molecular chaperone DnaK